MPEAAGKNKHTKIHASKNQTWKRGYRSKGPSTSMKVRAYVLIQGFVLLSAIALSTNLARIMLFQHDYYTEMANSRQFGTITIPAARGSIYDATGMVVAQSATVYKVFLDPGLFRKEMELVEKRNAENAESDENKSDIVSPEAVRQQLTEYLAEILEIDESKISDAFDKESNYVVLKKQVEKSRADKIIEYISDIRVPGSSRSIRISSISRESDTKRYYPQNELAASVIGFNNADGHGFYGVEKYYDEYLSGIDGRTITARDANGNEMPYRYSKTYAAQDGDDVYLTINMTLQTYLENEIGKMVETYKVGKRACGVMLNAKTGAVLAMASVGGFDANEPYEIYDPAAAAEIRSIKDEKKHDEALSEARETQWRNKCVTETYIPGSVFKVYTASAGLEEEKVNYDTDSFTCNGSVEISGIPIHCSIWPGAHGVQSFEDILKNSCNPAFIEIGRRLGKQLFCQYFEAFGLTEKTGIDLPGESSSIYTALSGMGPVELAASSYGQNNSLTPIEMVTGYASVVNGGYLLQPFVVSKIVDQAGNVVLSKEKTVRRQVISEETSAKMRKALQYVVDNNGGSNNAYIKGYKIGGKSGTAQKLMGYVKAGEEEYAASYCCFAPADDPEIVLLIMADEPDKTISYYGSTVVAPYSRAVLEKALPYLGYYPSYTLEEEAHKDITVPMVIDNSLAEAQKKLEDLGLGWEVIGTGNSINVQMPMTGTSVAKGGTVMLYTGKADNKPTVTVPYVIGHTLAEANTLFAEAGLNYVAKGSLNQDATILLQSVPAGTQAEKWSVISVDIGHNSDAG
ncbi:MAG: PASTA domain-containing protein [Oscillospiraceae bacterium]|nr:PASTA domain-containing protein [Oscillospiraceae bacterium]